jgi:hypothetical protein
MRVVSLPPSARDTGPLACRAKPGGEVTAVQVHGGLDQVGEVAGGEAALADRRGAGDHRDGAR